MIYNGSNPSYLEITDNGPWFGTDIVFYRMTHQFAACKVIAFGEPCSSGFFQVWNSAPTSSLLIDTLGQVESFEGPKYINCPDPTPYTNLSFETYDLSGT